jgi:3-phenylpropionate/cinnamic acid dioxygenase small subunit
MDGRHLERKQIIYSLRVFDAESGALLGQVADLSIKGFMMTSEHQMKKGRSMVLKVELPRSMNGPQELELNARVKWSRPDTNSSFFNTGLHLRLSRSDEKILSDLIRTFEYQEPPADDSPGTVP